MIGLQFDGMISINNVLNVVCFTSIKALLNPLVMIKGFS